MFRRKSHSGSSSSSDCSGDSNDNQLKPIQDPDQGKACFQNKIIRSDKNVSVRATVKVRTRVQLVDVNLAVDCVCIDNTPNGRKERSY